MALSDHEPIASTNCSVGAILNGRDLDGKVVPAEDVKWLRDHLGTPELRGDSASDIYDTCRAEGYRISYQQINRHRANRCGCRS